MRVYYTKSAPDLAYSSSRRAIGEPGSLLSPIEYAADGIAELLYYVVGPIFWLVIIWGLVSAYGAV